MTESKKVGMLSDFKPDRGAAVLIGDEPVAVFQLANGRVFAVSHIDPFTGTPTMARGMVGSEKGRAYVAAPMYKQRFDLATGACLDDDTVTLKTWHAELKGGSVWLSAVAPA